VKTLDSVLVISKQFPGERARQANDPSRFMRPEQSLERAFLRACAHDCSIEKRCVLRMIEERHDQMGNLSWCRSAPGQDQVVVRRGSIVGGHRSVGHRFHVDQSKFLTHGGCLVGIIPRAAQRNSTRKSNLIEFLPQGEGDHARCRARGREAVKESRVRKMNQPRANGSRL